MKVEKNHIELIQGGKKIIKSERKSEKKKGKKEKKSRKGIKGELGIKEKEKERKSKKKEEFDPEMNHENKIKLKNENKTAWNPNREDFGLCGKKIYSSGKHEIKIKIDQFPNPKNEWNYIDLGIIKTENRENFIKGGKNSDGIYFFQTLESKKTQKPKMQSRKRKMDQKNLPRKNKFKKKRHFHNFS
ncbi:hypothetical protein M0813_11464 [Anaeramoeba flamelloides]|uniref:Uncharacterized protein n=1 Tax=Anaeramoeba flamelloides TaxID=1746091 RepID=A0ABQ8ZEQ4_9EUKA|nr:hypothetical protein M0813_11464 [Anaeramoeba flamelloides]